MKTIYISKDYKCRVSQENDATAVETDVFDGKCKTYIEGMRFVPAGQSWTRSDGAVFNGEMIAPFKDSALLLEIQALHDEISTQQNSQDSQIAYVGMMTGVI